MTMSSDDVVWRPSQILERYRSGERDFRELDIRDPPPYAAVGDRFVSIDEPGSFRDAVLEGADFHGAFICADFTRASLRGASFADGNVKTSCFDEADLTDSDFTGSAIDAAGFLGARFDGTRFEGATAQGHSMARGELPSW
jgi:uncharacterized protein YjbI with pentapeptide repeats